MRVRSPRRPVALSLFLGLLACQLTPASPSAATDDPPADEPVDEPVDEPADGEDEKDEWDVSAPPGTARTASIDVTQGTWMSLDVSPDGATIVFDLLGDLYALPIEGGEARALTSGIAWDMQPRFSPDGTRIAFTSDRGGGDNVWVMGADGSDPRALTDEDFRLLNSPVWTPDGRGVAARKHFTSRRSLGAGEIWLYHASGTDGARGGSQMTEKQNQQKDLGEPAFSPDGRYLYYSYDATPGDTFEYSKDSTGQIYQIDRLDRETGEIRAVVTGPGGACRPTPSPDGRSIAFVRRLDFESTLFVQDLASGRARAVYRPLERDMQETWAVHGVYPTMAWTPDSKELVFWARGAIRRVDVATGESAEIPFRVTGERELREPVRYPVEVAPDEVHVRCLRHVAVAPAGERVAYQALGRVWLRDLPEGTPRRLTGGAEDAPFEYFPAFSRDGQHIAWTTFDDEALGAVWVADVSGANRRRLTSEPGHYVSPVFSPDGEHVVYEKVSGGYLVSPLWSFETGIYRAPVSGEDEPELLTRDGSEPQFGADPDLLFVSRYEALPDHDRRTLVSIRLSDPGPRRETTHFVSKNAVEWAVSPDGRWIAFSERYKAYVAPLLLSGREIELGPKATAVPVARVSEDAGENLQFSGDSTRLSWSLGPELFERDLAEAFAFLDGAPEELPGPVAEGRDVSFDVPYAKPTGAYALTGARIVTMNGDEVIEDGTIVVDGDRIVAVDRADRVALEPGMASIDCSGTTILPGFIDVHAHGGQTVNDVTPRHNHEHHANLAFGVTTIHDPSHGTNSIFAVSEMAKAGVVLAPRTFSTGTILYGAAGSFKAEVDSLEDARHHLRRLKAVGAFSVKSYNQPRRDQRQQVLEAARELEMMVVPEGGSLFQHNMTMVVDGHTGVEHCLPVERVYDDVLQLWGSTPVGYTPTLVVAYGGISGERYWYQHDDVWKNERLRTFVPRSQVEPRARRRTMAPEEDYNHVRAAGVCKALLDAGVGVHVGAHGQMPGLAAHWELWMLGQGGMTPHEALACATIHGARYLGLDGDLGSIERGKLADLIVLDENPLDDLRRSESIRLTILGGEVLDARTLQAIDPETGERGAKPTYFWEDLEPGQVGERAQVGCGCHAGG